MITKQEKREFKELGLSYISPNDDVEIVTARIKMSKSITPATINALNKLTIKLGINTIQTAHVEKVLKDGVLFDFGTVDEDVIYSESIRGRELYTKGILDLPFPRCMFKFKSYATEVQQDAEYFSLIDKKPTGIVVTVYIKSVMLNERVITPLATFEISDNNTSINGREGLEGTLLHPYYSEPMMVKEALNGAYKMAFCSLMILNTRYVPYISKVVPRTFNGINRTAKAKNSIVYVDGKIYTSLASTKKGNKKRTPHLRRGHVRTLATGKQIWVRDCLVNFTGGGDKNQLFSNEKSYKVLHDPSAEQVINNALVKSKKQSFLSLFARA